MRRTMVLSVNEDLTPLLSGIKVPTLLIWGENDTATPLSDGQTMERLIPGAGLVVLRGAGHFSFADHWGQCSRVLDSFVN
jgi:pimeloyl-ACP methyl ester carboxylesterase